MGHQAGQFTHDGRHAIDEDPLLEFKPQREIQLVGQSQGPLEILARDQPLAHHPAVGRQATGAVERDHPVVGNFRQLLQIARGTSRGDEQPHTPGVGRPQGLDGRTRYLVRAEADERPVHIQENGSDLHMHVSGSFSAPCPSRGGHRSP